MKNLNQFIIEKLKIDKNIENQYDYCPQERNELFQLSLKLIQERGIECDLNDIDTSKITDMSMLFQGSIFNGDISKWDVSNVTDMHRMFAYSDFNGNISSWKVNKNADMRDMFRKCPLKNNPPSWYKE